VPAWVSDLLAADARGARRVAGTDLQIVKTIGTRTGDPAFAFNGDVVTYTIALTRINPSDTLTEVVLIDVLPQDTLENFSIACSPACGVISETRLVPGVPGRFPDKIFTVTTQVTWTVPALTGAIPTATVKFWGRVIGQTEGKVFSNRAFVSYRRVSDNAFGSEASNTVNTIATTNLPNTGQASLSAAPTWLSDDLGGRQSEDWGDFDRDGFIDLALAGAGTTIYRNVAGSLQSVWTITKTALAVRWADLDDDGYLDLLIVGDTLMGQGANYIYRYDPALKTFTLLSTLLTPRLSYSVAVGRFNTNTVDAILEYYPADSNGCFLRYYTNNGAGTFTAGNCIAKQDVFVAMSAADVDNDGDLDLVAGMWDSPFGTGNKSLVFVNSSGSLTATRVLTLPAAATYYGYDLAWGDYDDDGFLDLAVSYPYDRKVQIFHNQGLISPGNSKGFALVYTITFAAADAPYALDWGDFDGDGRLDLIVSNLTLSVYKLSGNNPLAPVVTQIMSLPFASFSSLSLYNIRAVDTQNSGNLEVFVANAGGPSQGFPVFTPHLSPTLTPFTTDPSQHLAWGDFDGNGSLDVLLGAGNPPALQSRVRFNQNNAFSTKQEFFPSGFGPHRVAFGDVNGDGWLDAALATPIGPQLYLNNNFTTVDWTPTASSQTTALAWGDADDDGWLDLLVGNANGIVSLFMSKDGQLDTTPSWSERVVNGSVSALAWADLNRDHYPDFAAAGTNESPRVYVNRRNATFAAGWTTPYTTTTLAWGDFNGDAYPDLAIGNRGASVKVFKNTLGTLGATPVFSTAFFSQTVSVAWGDWDNDGLPELAIGNAGEANLVYANIKELSDDKRFVLAWRSSDFLNTTSVAWGDYDGNGYLDLGVSHANGAGVYRNTILSAKIPLPLNPPFVKVSRPGNTKDAYASSSSELLGSFEHPTVTIQYQLFDLDGGRSLPAPNTPGDPIYTTTFEFSLDGGFTWQTARPAPAFTPTYIITPTQGGQAATFIWDAQSDQAISDHALFRVRLVSGNRFGPLQRSSAIAFSPPFRVRGTTCGWPQHPDILFSILTTESPFVVALTGTVFASASVITYAWNFGDGTGIVFGQNVTHSYALANNYAVTLTVSGDACPQTREAVVIKSLNIFGPRVYLPLVLKNAAPARITGDGSANRQETGNSEHRVWSVERRATLPPTLRLRGLRRRRG
jgi:uncharacterized repeat protein (TIGR01451 family)